MATIYTIKRKTYSEEESKKSGMSTGGKVALGLGATAATSALAFAGARRGMFGAKTAMNANKMWGNLGSRVGSKKMVNSAANQYGKAVEKATAKRLMGDKTITEELQKEVNQRATNRGNRAKDAFLKRYETPGGKKKGNLAPKQKAEPKSVLSSKDPENVFKNDGIFGD